MKNTTNSTEIELTEETKKGLNFFQSFIKNLNWEHIISTLIYKVFLIIVVSLVIFIVRKILLKLIKTSFANYRKKETYSSSRLNTLETLARNAAHYFLFFVFLYSILTIIGIPVGSLVAGAGIAGVAIGLGAQGFINDVITGFFIIYERQLEVGDHVILDKVEGTVEQIGLRTTQVKSVEGTLNYIPNRQILVVSNLSRGNQQVVIDIRLQPDEDVEKVRNIMLKVNNELIPKLKDVRSDPSISGLITLPNGAFAIRASLYSLSGSQFSIKTQLTTAYISALTKAGINIPVSPINIGTT